jgi:8-amino-7-oxononanoate synthase
MAGWNGLEAALVQRQEAQLYRRRILLDSPQGVGVCCDGQILLSFCSNDYLGLANHPQVIEAFQRAARRYGVGSGASHLVTGHSTPHHQLEEALAEFTGRQRALVFSTGYMANLGVIAALLGRQDAVFEDKLNHASLIDAGLSSGARFFRYLHRDLDSLERRLVKQRARRQLIVTDGVFSMDGDLAPLDRLAALAQREGAWLMVDDAHGFGCIGPGGRGSAGLYDLNTRQLPLLVGTLGKAFGTFGAFLASSSEVVETLIQYARTYIYTTALPPAVAAATCASLRIVREEDWRRAHLNSLIRYFREAAAALDLQLMDSVTPIQPVVVGDAGEALRWSQALREQGILVTAIRPPTVPAGTARLRITFTADHTPAELDRLLDGLAYARRQAAAPSNRKMARTPGG